MTEASRPETRSAPARNPGIDLLRGLSILLVVLHHIGLRIPLKQGVLAAILPGRLLDALICNGYEAVFVFFVISGFLITSNSISRWGQLSAMDAGRFYIRRIARILPCLVLLVTVLSVFHLFGIKGYVITHAGQSLPRTVFAALAFHLNWYEGQTGWLPGGWDVLWSLSVEEVFYLGFPLLCLGVRRDRILIPLLVLAAFSLPASRAALADNPIWQEKAYLPGMAGIAMGVLGAMIGGRACPPRPWLISWLGLTGALGLVAVFCFADRLWPVLGNGAFLLLTISTICLVLAFHWRAAQGFWEGIPGAGWLCSFGRLSYEIYLTHMFIVFSVVTLYRASGANPWWGVLWYLPALVLSWITGALVARHISVPAEQTVRSWLFSRRERR